MNRPTEPLPRRTRIIHAKGTAQTAKDFGLKDFLEVRLLAPKWKDKIGIWFPSGKKTFDEGKPFTFRILPALSISTNDTDYAKIVPGRDPITDKLSLEMLRTIGIIDRFGSGMHKISFIPQTTYNPEGGYALYTSPNNNPLALLRSGLRAAARTNSLPSQWAPLIWSRDTVRKEFEKAGIYVKYPRTLLPVVQTRYVCYVWVYEGYDRKREEYIRVPECPIGSLPEHGLQMAVLPEQVYEALAHTYQLKEKTEGRVGNNFQCPDPANPNDGCLNYAWNRECASPVDGKIRKHEGFGYTATACADYYGKPNKPEEVDLAFTPEFDEWYYDNWQWWEDVLQPVTGVEQVKLTADYFPELGTVCRQIWDGQDALIDAMQKAPFSKKDDINFFDLLVAINSSEKASITSRGIKVTDSESGFEESDYEPTRPAKQSRQPSRKIDEEEEDIYGVTYGQEPDMEEKTPPSRSRRRSPFTSEEDDDEIEVEAPTVRKRSIHSAVADNMRQQRSGAASVGHRTGRSTATVANKYDESDYEDE